MKTLFISILLICSLSSCAASLSTTSEVSGESFYEYDNHYITYYYEYIFYDVHCPVIYINAFPWYYYHGVWYVVPQSEIRYITHYRVGRYYRISTYPPYRYNKPVYHKNHRHTRYRSNHNHGYNYMHKPMRNQNVRPYNRRPNQHYNRSINRTTHNSVRTNRR